MISIEDLAPEIRKVDNKSYKHIITYYVGNETSSGIKSCIYFS